MTAKEEITCDVLVAGAGAGGFAAALSASHRGLDVIVCEKEPLFGGTTAYAVGGIWMPGNAQARAAGIEDSAARALMYLESKVGSRLNREKASAYLEHCAEMLDFFERHTHVRYALQKRPDYHPELPGAVMQGRSMLPEPFDGRLLGEHFPQLRPPLSTTLLLGGMSVNPNDVVHLFNARHSLVSARHVAGLLGRYARDRLQHRRGTRLVNGNALIARLARSLFDRGIPLWLSAPITSIEQRDGRVVGATVQRHDGSVRTSTRRGVVLASGGFAASAPMRRQYFAHVSAGRDHAVMASPGNTGDGIRLAAAVGARFVEDAWHPAAWTPVSLVPQPDGTRVPFPHFIDRCKPGYIAVTRAGLRFANEAQSYHDFVPALIEASKAHEHAEAFLVCDQRHQPNPCVAPLATAPFYAARIVPSDLGTLIGLATDRCARVLDRMNHPIQGLYAVGNDQASAMARTYPGAGIMLGTALTFGYVAGKDLADRAAGPS